MNITFNTYPTTTMPSICAGPFTVSFSARPIACCAEYELSLCAYDSNSYSHYSVQDEDRLYLIPRWRFLDTNFNIVSSLPISTVSGVDGISGTASFWYIDDMPAPDVKINVEVRNIINYPVSSCNVSAIMGTTSASAMISLSVGEWTPQLVKYTSDGISDISAKWTEHPIKWYATLHQELSGPIIFSYSYNLTSDLVSVSSEFCPLTAEVLSFDKNGNYGWVDGSCITNISSTNAYISGTAVFPRWKIVYHPSNETTIIDTLEMVEWQYDYIPFSSAWLAASSQWYNLSYGEHDDWRLPTLNELTIFCQEQNSLRPHYFYWAQEHFGLPPYLADYVPFGTCNFDGISIPGWNNLRSFPARTVTEPIRPAYVTGTSNEFKIRQFTQPFEIRRQNESWDATKSIKTYAMAPHLNSKYNLWDNFIGHSVGQLIPGQQLGRKSYERIANFPANHIDIDESNVKQLYSLSQYLDVPIDDYDLNYPPELQRLIDIGSISHSKLWGEIVKCNLNITDSQVCPRCGYTHTNLGSIVTDPFTYEVTAGVPFIQHDRFNLSSDGWVLEYPPIFEYYGRIWETQLSAVSANWTFPALNYSGQYQTIGQNNGNLYTSNDYGKTWNINLSPAVSGSLPWIGQAMCGSGQYQLGGANNAYISNDYGTTWTQTTASAGWSVGMDNSGKYQLSITDRIQVSHDYGQTWFIVEDADIEGGISSKTYWGAAVSLDGQHMLTSAEGNLAGPAQQEFLYTSNDYGRTWIRNSDFSAHWWWAAMSGNGQHRMAVTYMNPAPPLSSNGQIYVSNDFGNNWSAVTGPGLSGYNWWVCGMDKTGRFMMAGHEHVVVVSWDYGATWTQEDLYIQNEAHMGMSGDGLYQVIGDGLGISSIPSNFYSIKRNVREKGINPLSGSLCEKTPSDTITLSTYPLYWLSAYDLDLCSYYDYYNYIDDFPRIETCLPLASAYVQAAGVINRNDEYNTLDVYSVSSVEDWFGDDGKLQEAIEYELLRGLQLNSQTCNISS